MTACLCVLQLYRPAGIFCLHSPLPPLPPMVQQPLVCQALLLIEASLSHSFRHTTIGKLLWMSDKPDAKISTWQHTTLTRDRHPIPQTGFEPALPTSEPIQTHTLDSAATGIDLFYPLPFKKICPPHPRGVLQWQPRPLPASPASAKPSKPYKG